MTHIISRTTAIILSTLLLFAFAPTAFAAISTDKDEYSPGETVTISGDGYLAGETVAVTVDAPYGVEYAEVTANGSGEFVWSFVLPNDHTALGDYTYTALGLTSGFSQNGVFSDGNVKAFPIPTNVTFTLTLTTYSGSTCSGIITDGPDVETGVSHPSGETTGVGSTESLKMQAAAVSDQGTAFLGWTTSVPFVATSTTVVSGDTICVVGSFTGNRSYFANYAPPPTTGTLTLEKIVINDNGGTAVDTDWTLSANGPTPISGAEGDASITNAVVTPGVYDLSETGPAGYSSSGVWSCVGGNQTDDDVVEVAAGNDVTCTITNDDIAPQLTVIKTVINDDGGTALVSDFTLTVGDGGATTTVTSGASNPFDVGNYVVGESGPSGYAGTIGGDCAADGSIAMALGGTYTCTITNNDDPPTNGQLTVTKTVVNDNGGTAVVADFILNVGDGNATTTVTSGVADSFAAGDYVVEENGPSGYAGTFGGDCAADGSITVLAGQTYSCTITNDDNEPSLTLQKVVVNDDGGVAVASDWTLTATGPTGFSGLGPSVSNGASFDVGTYDLSEAGPAGYTASAWVCIGGNQIDGDTVEIGLGESVTCTITNDDNPIAPVSSCPAAPSTGFIRIRICNNGSVNTNTQSLSHSGLNLALGSVGGNGSSGGAITTGGGAGDDNNGGASGGSGGSGGASSDGGFIRTGVANSVVTSFNDLNRSAIRVGR